jgi:hypothetical protein
MSVGIEHIILIITAVAGVLKAYFEMKKAKAQSLRADDEATKAQESETRAEESENLLKTAVEGLEEAKIEAPEAARRIIDRVKKQTVLRGVALQFDEVVQEVTKGEGDVKKITQKLSRDRLLDSFDAD